MDEARGLTARIAEFVAGTRLDDVPTRAIDGAKLLILDTLGVGLAAASQPAVRQILEHVGQQGGRPVSTVIASGGLRTSAPLAALANGCVVNALDYDGFWHVPTHVLPAALAAGELVGADGRSVLEAFVLAAEVADRLRETIDGLRGQDAGPTHRGWYHVSLYGPITAALAASKLLGLDAALTRAAVGAAASGSGGVRRNLGTSAKSLASGHSAATGVHAALLARRGIAGDPEILEGRVGLLGALCLPGECDPTAVLERLGQPYALAGSLGLKAFPAVGPTQGVIGSLRAFKAANPFDAADVEWVEARVSAFSAGTDYPVDPLEAGFRWPYILASTLTHGTFGVDELTPRAMENPDVRRLASRIRFLEPAHGASPYVAIGLRDGRTLRTEIDRRLGRVDTAEAIEQKFRDCAGRYLAAEGVARLQEAVMALEKLDSIASLTGLVA